MNPPQPPPNVPIDYVETTLDSVVISPTTGTVLPSAAPVQVRINAASTLGYLRIITFTVDGAAAGAANFADGAALTASVTVTWSPPGAGTFVLASQAVDWDGAAQATLHPVTVTVDVDGPAISIATTVLTTAHQIAPGVLPVVGPVTATGAFDTAARANGAPFAASDHDATDWSFAWPAGMLDGVSVPFDARVTDGLARMAQASRNILVDNVPPAAFALSPFVRIGAGPQTPITTGQLITRTPPTLIAEWTPSSDGSGLAGYLAGWTTSPTPTLAGLNAVPAAGPLRVEQAAAEARAYYAHVAAVDLLGNMTWMSFGPVFVDAPTTPDLIGDLAVRAWLDTGGSHVSSDATWALRDVNVLTQELYASWDSAHLRLAWVGADWTTDGDAFFYFDGAAGGASQAHDPFASGVAIAMPAGVAPETLVWVRDATTAELWRWNGAAWAFDRALDTGEFATADVNGRPVADVLLAFSALGVGAGSPLKMLALASEDGALRLWASAPDRTPLNSARVNPAAPSSVALTQFFGIASLADGVTPNGGVLPGAHVEATISVSPAAGAVTYLDDGRFEALPQGGSLDAAHDGVSDAPSVLPTLPTVGAGQALAFQVVLRNAGDRPARNVTLTLQALGAAQLGGPTTLAVGDIAAGGTHTVTVNAAATGPNNGSELIAALADRLHRDYDWLWGLHAVDRDAPGSITVTQPTGHVAVGQHTIVGLASDPSGVPTVTVEVKSIPSLATILLTCPDASPDDGVWTCPWPIASVAGVTAFELRARATDRLGNVSAFSDLRRVEVDASPPTITLAASVNAWLVDGFINASEMEWSGQVIDDRAAIAADVCLAVEDGGCAPAAIHGSGPTVGWFHDLSGNLSGDGITKSIQLYGFDAAGNRSAPVSRTFRVDTVAPVIGLAGALQRMSAEATVSGSVTDGGGVAGMNALVVAPNGAIAAYPVILTRDTWSFVVPSAARGVFVVQLIATDRAGNVSVYGPFAVFVEGPPTSIDLLSLSATPVGAQKCGRASDVECVAVRWQTVAEDGTLGFRLYRAVVVGEQEPPFATAIEITTGLILAEGGSGGASYAWTDASLDAPGDYAYWVEEIAANGAERFGPARVRVRRDGDDVTEGR